MGDKFLSFFLNMNNLYDIKLGVYIEFMKFIFNYFCYYF